MNGLKAFVDEEVVSEFIKQNDFLQTKEDILNYLCFSFNRYALSKAKIRLNWIIGNKAILEWKKRTDQQTYYSDKFRLEMGLKSSKKRFDKVVVGDNYRDIQRNMFYNTGFGKIWCLQHKLFDIKNEKCIKCNFYYECKVC